MGCANNTGMGLTRLSWQEIESYSRLSGVDLTPWESEQVINMSREYCLWKQKGAKQDCQAPWIDEKNLVANTAPVVNSGFKALIKRAKQNESKKKKKAR